MNTTRKILLIGFMGAGKSYWCQTLSEMTEYSCVDSDTLMESEEKKSIAQLFEGLGEQGFRALERQYLHQIVEMPGDQIIATGGGAPCFFDNMDYLNQHGCTIYLKMSAAVLVKRLEKGKAHRPLLRDLDTAGLTAFITKKLEERRFFYEQSQHVLEYNGDNAAFLSALIQIITTFASKSTKE